MMKKLVTGLLSAACMALLLSGCGTQDTNSTKEGNQATEAKKEEQKDPLKLKVSISPSEADSWGIATKKWAEDIEKKSNGRITMKVYPNDQLSNGNQPKGLEAVQNGSTEISLHSTVIYNVLDKKFAAPSLPWLLPTYEDAEKAMNGEAGEKLKDLIRSKGIEPLAFGESGYRQITNNVKPIVSPEDLAGLKIRTPSMTMMLDTYKELGADPTTMNFSEVFTSLQQGVIDGQENPISVIYNAKLYETQKFLTLWNYMYDPIVFGMNKKLYDSLDAETQKLIKETAQEAAKNQIELNRKQNDEMLSKLKEEGMQVTELTPEQIKAFQEKMQPVMDQYQEIIGKDLMDVFNKK